MYLICPRCDCNSQPEVQPLLILFLYFIILFYNIATETVENIRTTVSLTREKAFGQMYEETLQTQHR